VYTGKVKRAAEMMAPAMPMCSVLFGYPVPTIILPCGIQVCLPTFQQVTPGICRWTKGGTGAPRLHRQLTLFGGCYFRSKGTSFAWTPISNAISTSTLESENKPCSEIYSIDQYECSYQGSCTNLHAVIPDRPELASHVFPPTI
jgi:hypothetical protein